MKRFPSSFWTIPRMVTIAFFYLLLASFQTAHAGRNAGGALIVHTNDAVNYSAGRDYCGPYFDDPGTCEAAGTRTDKDEDTPAVIWVIAAFPLASSPAVTAVQFGLNDNIPEGNWEAWDKCGAGALEIPDEGWPVTGKGTVLAFPTARTDHLFPLYWFAAYGFADSTNAYLGTAPYHLDRPAEFADDSNPPVSDIILGFGVVRWFQDGFNDCPDSHRRFSFEREYAGEYTETYVEPTPEEATLSPTGPDVTYYLDVNADDSFAITLRRWSGSGIHLFISYYSAITGAPLPHQSDTITLPDNGSAVSLGPYEFDHTNGLIRILITTDSGNGVYSFRPEANLYGDTDIELFNARPTVLAVAPGLRLPFWVPPSANRLRIQPVCSYHAQMVTLEDGAGSVDYGWRYLDEVFEVPVDPEVRGTRWFLCVLNGTGQEPTGTLRVDFMKNDGMWWTPTYAFRPNDTVAFRAEMPEHELLLAGDRTAFYVPGGLALDNYTQSAEPPCAAGQAESIVLTGRQWFGFACHAYPERHVTLHNVGDYALVEWHARYYSDPDSDTVMLAPGETKTITFRGGYGRDGVLYVRAMQEYRRINVTTDAPLAVVGPVPGLQLEKCASDLGISDDYYFWVPAALASIECDVEAYASKTHDEDPCLWYRYSPNEDSPLTVELIGPDGDVYPFQLDSGGLGRRHISLAVPGPNKWFGAVWGIRFTSSEPLSGQRINVVFGDSIPPYFSWLGPDRLFLPAAYPLGSRMQHRVDVPIPISWRLPIPEHIFCSKVGACADASNCIDTAADYAQVVTDQGRSSGDEYERGHWCRLRLLTEDWILGPARVFYEVGRPLGLTDAGDLRAPDDSEPRIFTSIHGPVGACQDGTYPPCVARATEIAQMPTTAMSLPSCSDLEEAVHAATDLPELVFLGYLTDPKTPVNYDAIESAAEEVADRVNETDMLAIAISDEPLLAGYDTEVLYHALYRIRKANEITPVWINDETNIVNARELRDVLEVWADNEYYLRNDGGNPSRWPLCKLTAVLQNMNDLKPPGVATRMYYLGGYKEGELYLAAGPDEVGAQGIAALLYRTDSIELFSRFWATTDPCGNCASRDTSKTCETEWSDSDSVLWARLPNIASMDSSLASWIGGVVYGTGLAGGTVTECQVPPVVYGYGMLPDPMIATWVAVANLGERDRQWFFIPWNDLRLGDSGEGDVTAETLWRSAADLSWTLVTHDGFYVMVDRKAWFVCALRTNQPASVDLSAFGTTGMLIRPNPVDRRSKIEIWGCPERTTVRVYDVSGRLVMNLGAVEKGERKAFALDRAMDAGRLAGGVYSVEARGDKGWRKKIQMVILR